MKLPRGQEARRRAEHESVLPGFGENLSIRFSVFFSPCLRASVVG
jgi:hypothetical protein